MKMKTIAKFLIAFMMPLAFFACSSDDDPATKAGEEQVAHLRSFLLDDEGEIVYPESSTQGVYILPAASDKAHRYTEAILDDKWNGESQTYKLADNKGSVKISKAPKEGVFVSLSFNVSSIPAFTLEIVSEEYFHSDNWVIHKPVERYKIYRCNDCGKVREGADIVYNIRCYHCGSKNLSWIH